MSRCNYIETNILPCSKDVGLIKEIIAYAESLTNTYDRITSINKETNLIKCVCHEDQISALPEAVYGDILYELVKKYNTTIFSVSFIYAYNDPLYECIQTICIGSHMYQVSSNIYCNIYFPYHVDDYGHVIRDEEQKEL